MNLKLQVPSFELCQRLKELGFPQESYFYWCKHNEKIFIEYEVHSMSGESKSPQFIVPIQICSAPSVAELGEALPLALKEDMDMGISYSVERCGLQIYKTYSGKSWVIHYFNRYKGGDTEADARANMWIYLKENNLI